MLQIFDETTCVVRAVPSRCAHAGAAARAVHARAAATTRLRMGRWSVASVMKKV